MGILQRVKDVIVNCVPYALFEVVANIFGLLFIVFRIKQKIITWTLALVRYSGAVLPSGGYDVCQLSNAINELRFKI